MKNLQALLDELQEAHRKVEGRDVNEVARLFTMCNNLGAKLNAFDFLGPVKPIERVWDAQKSHQ